MQAFDFAHCHFMRHRNGSPKSALLQRPFQKSLLPLLRWVEVGIPGWSEATECVNPFPLHTGAHCSGPARAVTAVTRDVVVVLG